MKLKISIPLVLPVLCAALAAPVAADTRTAECELFHHGDRDDKHSGRCEFSQRQGYITIRLRNGKTFELSPTDEHRHYRDQKGHAVKLRDAGTSSSIYKWEKKRLEVHWNRAPDHSRREYESPDRSSNTPPALRDLVGASARHSGDEMARRGYAKRDGWADGDSRYSTWEEQENGSCVRMRVSDGRIQSIEYAAASECRR